ncbi:MAG: hypothetical protein ACXADW_23805 [Candidatus Hodarchaeales archaeon]
MNKFCKDCRFWQGIYNDKSHSYISKSGDCYRKWPQQIKIIRTSFGVIYRRWYESQPPLSANREACYFFEQRNYFKNQNEYFKWCFDEKGKYISPHMRTPPYSEIEYRDFTSETLTWGFNEDVYSPDIERVSYDTVLDEYIDN